jgi:hypothetical protein
MTIRELLISHGITTIKYLSVCAGWTKQEAWNDWHGAQKVGARRAIHLHLKCGLDILDCLNADPAPDYGVHKSPKNSMA